MKQGWEIKKLGEVAFFINGDRGKNYPSQRDFVNDGVPFINAGHIVGGNIDFSAMNYISEEKFNQLGSGKVINGDLLFCLRGSLGKRAIVKDLYCGAIASSLVIIRSKDVLLNKYLFHYLGSHAVQDLVTRNDNGSSQPNLSAKSVSNFPIPVPPLPEQEKIVSELDCLSGIIEKKRQQLKELDALAQSIFYEMFGNPLENEKGWKVSKLGDISIKIANGYNAKLEEGTYKPIGIPYFRCQNIWWNNIDYADIVYIDEETNEKMKSSSLMNNDLIISKIGRVYTENSSLGRTAIYEGEDKKANISGNLCYVRLNGSVVPKFVLRILTLVEYRKWAMKNTPGGIDKRAMSVSQISNFPIILPPLPLQQTFAQKVEAIEKQKELIKQSIIEAETLLASRMQYYFEEG